MKKYSNISSWFVILFNLPLVYIAIGVLIEDGGFFGLGWLVMPYLLGCNAFLIPAIINLFVNNIRTKKVLLVINIIGLIPSLIAVIDIVIRQF